ncbi:hypothetical protein SI65_05514 [Aspergillus cristatus]|uniref:Uncharacterized protein n=1 Tax=Aspergillus cristatus TaxID=573508 RepID=A0A1E3BD87_ASPCR|nr:hypothetical protein SI65_05514 [Aspergillus cristatus]
MFAIAHRIHTLQLLFSSSLIPYSKATLLQDSKLYRKDDVVVSVSRKCARHSEDGITDFLTVSDDTKCSCQPAPSNSSPEKMQAFLFGDKPGQVRQLHQPGAELDIHCDVARHEMTLRETVGGDPRAISTATRYDVHLNPKNSRLLNLEGLPDDSILLTIEIRPEACRTRGHGLWLQTKVWSFRPAYTDSKLHNEFYLCDWSKMILRVHLPVSRFWGWKTVAMLLVTFERLTWGDLCIVAGIKDMDVAGLNWRQIEQHMRNGSKRDALVMEVIREERMNKERAVEPGPYELWF